MTMPDPIVNVPFTPPRFDSLYSVLLPDPPNRIDPVPVRLPAAVVLVPMYVRPYVEPSALPELMTLFNTRPPVADTFALFSVVRSIGALMTTFSSVPSWIINPAPPDAE